MLTTYSLLSTTYSNCLLYSLPFFYILYSIPCPYSLDLSPMLYAYSPPYSLFSFSSALLLPALSKACSESYRTAKPHRSVYPLPFHFLPLTFYPLPLPFPNHQQLFSVLLLTFSFFPFPSYFSRLPFALTFSNYCYFSNMSVALSIRKFFISSSGAEGTKYSTDSL